MNQSLTIISMMILMMFSLFIYMKESNNSKKNKKISFECGFNQISMKKTTFSTNFLLIMMMFLIFDVEISFLIPMIMSNKMKTMTMNMCTTFLILLTIILIKEWKQGSLEWNK